MLIVSATQTFLFFSAVWWTIMHCNGVKWVASCNTMYQNYQKPSLPSGSDILRYIWTCRASAIYDIPINCRYIQQRCPALMFTPQPNLHLRFMTCLSVANIKYRSVQKPSPGYHHPSLSWNINFPSISTIIFLPRKISIELCFCGICSVNEVQYRLVSRLTLIGLIMLAASRTSP